MWSVLLRGLRFLERFVVSAANFGIGGALRVHVVYRMRRVDAPVHVWLRAMQRPFYFRGAADLGVLSHFFTPGYRIRVPPGSPPIRHVVDAGANIGDETIRFRFFHPDATVYALEAEPRNFKVLEMNAAGDSRIVAINKALWSHRCRLVITQRHGNEDFQVREAGPHEAATLDATSIPDVMRDHGIPHIDILKLDIEGAERAVFSKDVGWVSAVKAVIVEPPDRDAPFTTMCLLRRLEETGRRFNCYVHGENLILIREDAGWDLESNVFLS